MHQKIVNHQERIWFINEFENGKLYDREPIYHNIPLMVGVKGEYNRDALVKCVQQVLNKHEVLRANVRREENDIKLILQDDLHLNIASKVVENSSELSLINSALTFASKPFNLENDILVRGELFTSDDESILCLVFHHLLMDQESIKEIYRQIINSYYSIENSDVNYKDDIYFQYSDFLSWQHSVASSLKEKVHKYWKLAIEGRYEPIELPTDNVREDIHVFESQQYATIINENNYNRIKEFSKQESISEASVLFGLFSLLLHKYSNQDGLLIGTFTPNRTNGLKIIGPASNLFPVLSNLIDSHSLTGFIKSFEDSYKKALVYSQYPFDLLVKELNIKKDMSRTALFDVLFYYDAIEVPSVSLDNTELSLIETNVGYGKYDLNTLVRPNDKGELECTITFNGLYYNNDSVKKMFDNYLLLIDIFLEDASLNAAKVELLTEREKEQLYGNIRKNEYSESKSIIDYWNQQVLNTPRNIAVSFLGKNISYTDLDVLSTNVAINLQQKFEVEKGDFVAIMLHNSEYLIAVLLGVLKCGAAYIPIDPNSPTDRVSYFLKDSCGKVLISEDLPKDVVATSICNVKLEEVLKLADSEQFKNYSTPDDNAYVIYTSGTANKPKGCVITHKNVVNLMKNDSLPFDFNDKDVWLLAHSYSFDFSVWEIFGALLFGGRLVITNRESLTNLYEMRKLIVNERITVLNQTPSTFKAFIKIEQLEETHTLDTSLRAVIFGGERLDYKMLREWSQIYSIENIVLVNMFGITETTVHTTFYQISDPDISDNNSSIIGFPLPGSRVHILNEYMMHVPINVVGEMFIESPGIAEGYLNNPELTHEKFLKNFDNSISRLYKSGDLAKWSNTGELIYIGRADTQVKLRGYRIELSEIEYVLKKYKDVIDVVVAVREDVKVGKYLVAYVVYKGVLRNEYKKIKSYISSFLPNYMIPAYYIQIDEVPLTINMKTDYNALGAIDIQYAVGESNANEEVNNTIESKLLEICSDILKRPIDKININDNFFDIGGQSITAVYLSNEIVKVFFCEVSLKDIFVCESLKSLAKTIRYLKGSNAFTNLKKADIKPFYKASYTQRSIYLTQAKNKKSTAYNMPFLLEIANSVDTEKVIRSLNAVVKRHESFYTNFEIQGKDLVQIIRPFTPLEIQQVNLCGTLDYQEVRKQIKPFDLTNDILIRCVLINTSNDGSYLFFDVHHIICDAISIHILTREFIATYKDIPLNDVTFQYKDYSDFFYNPTLSNQLDFWLEMWSGDLDINNLNGQDGDDVSEEEIELLSFELDEEQTTQIRKLAKDRKVTIFSILFSLLNVLFSKICREDLITIGVPFSGRNHSDLAEIVGCFVNLVFIKSEVDSSVSFHEYVDTETSKLYDIQDNQNYPFDLVKKEVPDAITKFNNSNSVVFQLLELNNFQPLPDDTFRVVKDVRLNESNKYDLLLNCLLSDRKLIIDVTHDKSVYGSNYINNVMRNYLNIIDFYLKKGDKLISNFDLDDTIKISPNNMWSDLSQGFKL